jgi:hypothetical protein
MVHGVPKNPAGVRASGLESLWWNANVVCTPRLCLPVAVATLDSFPISWYLPMDSIPLSPVDHLFLSPGSQPITFALSYAPTLDPEALRTGLEKTLEAFPLVSCRLARGGEADFVFRPAVSAPVLEVLESGVPFTSAEGTSPYITPVRSVEGSPLAKFTLTRTPSGSVLAASISHAVVDGFSYFHFLSSWARICRRERSLPPSFDRTFFEHLSAPVETVDLLASCGLFAGERRAEAQSAVRRAVRSTLSAEDMKAIVDDARRSAGVSLTENDVLVAFLWKRFLSGKSGGDSYVTCPVDFRQFLPGFPRTYFGCALAFATASLPAEELANAPVGRLAVLVRDAVASVKADRIQGSLGALDRYRAEHGAKGMERVHLRHPERGLIVTNLTRMPIHDVDFGSGPPIGYVPYVEISGGAAIVPAAGGVSIISMDGPSSSQFGPFH